VYGPSWLKIKRSSNFTEGPKLVFDMMADIWQFEPCDKKKCEAAIQQNCFCLYPENFLMLCSTQRMRSIDPLQLKLQYLKALQPA
jgi:hypothetical protein